MLVGVRGGFAQFGHGKLAPAKRPAKCDWIIYYSGKEKLGESLLYQRFVAIGQVLDAAPRQVTQAPGFKPWRRRVPYSEATEVPIQPLIERLSFIKNKARWSAPFRFGFLQITEADFTLIAKRMLPPPRWEIDNRAWKLLQNHSISNSGFNAGPLADNFQFARDSVADEVAGRRLRRRGHVPRFRGDSVARQRRAAG